MAVRLSVYTPIPPFLIPTYSAASSSSFCRPARALAIAKQPSFPWETFLYFDIRAVNTILTIGVSPLFCKVVYTLPRNILRLVSYEDRMLIQIRLKEGKRIIDSYTAEDVFEIELWYNSLPRKILGYHSPEEIFSEGLDKIYSLGVA